MLTLYHRKSSFKKKFSVVVIWFMALFMLIGLIEFIHTTSLSLWIYIVPALSVLIVIAGLILRCKIARGFTLVGIYIIMLLPFMYGFMKNISIDLTQTFYTLMLGSLAIYVLSNEKAMELFYIESNPREHLFYPLIAILLTGGYFFLN